MNLLNIIVLKNRILLVLECTFLCPPDPQHFNLSEMGMHLTNAVSQATVDVIFLACACMNSQLVIASSLYCRHQMCQINWHLKTCPKTLHYDSALKRKVFVSAEKHGNRAAGRTFDVSEANIRPWRNDWNSVFSCKATKSFTGPKQGRDPKVEEAVLHFVTETRVKGLPSTCQAVR